METIDITIKREVKEIMVVSLPLFRKSICHFYKVYSPDNCIKVTTGGSFAEIGRHDVSLAFSPDIKDCTEEEFLQEYEKATAILRAIAKAPH